MAKVKADSGAVITVEQALGKARKEPEPVKAPPEGLTIQDHEKIIRELDGLTLDQAMSELQMAKSEIARLQAAEKAMKRVAVQSLAENITYAARAICTCGARLASLQGGEPGTWKCIRLVTNDNPTNCCQKIPKNKLVLAMGDPRANPKSDRTDEPEEE